MNAGILIYTICFVTALGAIDGSKNSMCKTAFTTDTFPVVETVKFDESVKEPGTCGEDREDVSSVWVMLKNTETKSRVFKIKTDADLAFHTTCDSECVDILPQQTSFTVPAESTFFLVFKGKGTASIEITEVKESGTVTVENLPYEGSFTSGAITTQCTGKTTGVLLDIKTSEQKLLVSTCGSTAAAQVIVNYGDKCVTPEQHLCENGNGVIATVDAQNIFKVEIVTGTEGAFSDGLLAVSINKYVSPECQKADVWDFENTQKVSGVINDMLPSETDVCSKDTAYSYVFYKLIGQNDIEVKARVVEGNGSLNIHVFNSCEMKECVDNIEIKQGSDTSFTVRTGSGPYYLKVASNSDLKFEMSGSYINEKKINTVMKVVIAVFIVAAALVICVGIGNIIYVFIRNKRRGYNKL